MLGLNPLFVSIEQAIRKQLLPAVERVNLKAEFNRDAFLAMDSQARAALFSVQAQNGLRTRNEMRAKENLPPLPGGDVLTVQSNMIPLDQLGATGSDAEQARTALMKFLGLGLADDRQPPAGVN